MTGDQLDSFVSTAALRWSGSVSLGSLGVGGVAEFMQCQTSV